MTKASAAGAAQTEGRVGLARVTRWLSVVVGPILIAGAVLGFLRSFAFQALIAQADMARYWLPLHCVLGQGLSRGVIPTWNPHVFGGVPLAADPQGGWLNLPVMVLFLPLDCGTAIRWLVVIEPVLAGLGMYWFLTGERLSRAAATLGGLVLALAIATSEVAISIRFPAVLAWTVILLGAAGKAFRSERWSSRLGWLLVGAVSWGQLAVAHLGTGLLLGSAALAMYAGAVLWRRSRGEPLRRSWWLLLLVPMSAGVNLAAVLPRLALLPRLSLGRGYWSLNRASVELGGSASPTFPGFAAAPTWPLNFATVPGRYLGAAVLLLSFAGFWSSRRQHLTWAFAVYGILCYLGTLRVVAHNIPSALWSWPVLDQYLHEPTWLSFGLFISLAVLAALGFDAYLEAGSWRRRALMLAPGAGVWGLLTLALLPAPAPLAVFAVAGAATLAMLAAAGRPARQRWRAGLAAAIPVVLVGEVAAAAALAGPDMSFRRTARLLRGIQRGQDIGPYLEPGAFANRLMGEEGRYLTLARSRRPQALPGNQGALFGVEGVEGYQSVQLDRYWRFVRAVTGSPMRYQHANLSRAPPAILDLLQVNWLIAREGPPPEPGATETVRDGRWVLYRRSRTVPRVSLLFDWTVVSSSDAALAQVSAPGFDPTEQAVLESDPGIVRHVVRPLAGETAYSQLGSDSARVTVETPVPAILLVRNVWDPVWRATIDGKAADVFPVDFVLQGVAVPAGKHTVDLRASDPWMGAGLWGSALSIGAICIILWVLRRREREANAGV